MPFISRRKLAELHASVGRLRDRAETAEQAAAVQSGANGLLAARTGDTEAQLRELLRVVKAENQLLRGQVSRQRTTIRGLNSQLDHALGYTAEEIGLLDAGAVGTKKASTTR